jgi:hypothetical protein
MKIAALIIHRGDRQLFLDNLKRMLAAQTVQSDIIHYVDYPPESDKCDISQRYKRGYEALRNKGIDLIFLMEVDDYYAPNYIETMLAEWHNHNCPDIFGTNYTIYYHIKLFSHFTFYHNTRSSAMSTLLKADLKFDWPVDEEPFTDVWLWNHLKGITFKPEKHICLGIKHGLSVTGGSFHSTKLHRYISDDKNKDFLRENMDSESFNFYSNLIK